MPAERMVATPRGEARVVARRAKRPIATLVLTHGAGGGIDAPDLLRALSAHLFAALRRRTCSAFAGGDGSSLVPRAPGGIPLRSTLGGRLAPRWFQ